MAGVDRGTNRIRSAKIALYRQQGKIHPRATAGRFDRLRWTAAWLTQIVFYGAPWLVWDGRQAILLDIAREKFHVFGLTLWPQDALLLALLLIGAASGLFLATALAGRVFCGFACPQTVYTAIFTWLEARIEGDHLARLRLDQAPYGPRKLLLRGAKHGIWLLVAAWTGLTFVGYFTPIRELLPAVAHGGSGPWETFWLLFYGLFTYVQAGLAREAVCQHMCPYSRFQGVMSDADTRATTYDAQRGEPRGRERAGGGGRGDCVDCGICVEVCPAGIDIRDGAQYACINCGLCADACDTVMDKLERPPGLIRFAAERELAGGRVRPLARRPRVLAYAGLCALCMLLGAVTLATRPLLRVDVLRDRGALLRETADGDIENAYTLRLANLAAQAQTLEIAVHGMAGLRLVGDPRRTVAAGSVTTAQVTLRAPGGDTPGGARPIRFEIVPAQHPAQRTVETSTFILPGDAAGRAR
jgi:cytochrome c oxidase accessory protein FixG